ncbi:alpha/beta fold hydrolase [Skermania piniformis]
MILLPLVARAGPTADSLPGIYPAPLPASIAEVPMRPGPPQNGHGTAARYARDHPGTAPPGANDFSCRSKDHSRPVVLLHGTDANAYSDWAAISPRLRSAGYCPFAVNYGGRPGEDSFGTEDITRSAYQVADFVARVRAETGAPRVDLIGYSQGATVARLYVNRLGGAASVARWIGLASPTYGGVLYGAVPIAQAIPGALDVATQLVSVAAVQQVQGSPLLDDLNAGGDTVAGVEYTTIGSRYDEVIQPADNAALRSPGATNIVLQDSCPVDLTGHFHLVYDPYVIDLLLTTLDAARPRTAPCVPVPLGTGIAELIEATYN